MGLSRRRLLVLATAGSLAGACGRPNPAPPPVFDAFASAPDGPLAGRRTASGHRWIAVGGPGDDPPVVLRGAIGPPADHVPGLSRGRGDTNPAAAAGYAMLDTVRPTGRVGCVLRWDRSASTTSAIAMGAFTGPPVPPPGRRRTSSMHLGLSPTGMLLTVFARGSDIDSRALAADGYPRGFVTFPRPMRCDGAGSYRIEITLDRAASSALVSVGGVGEDGETVDLEFEDPLIAAVPANLAFWQYYTARGATNLPRFVEVWAAPA